MENPHILVVDNEADIRKLVKLHLRKEQMEVIDAASGADAIAILKQHPIDLMVLDIMMEPMSGWDVLEYVRSKSFDMPVIVLSARHPVNDKIKMLKLGADDYLTKPFSLGELTARIQALLRRYNPSAKTDKVKCGSFIYDRTTQLLEKPSGTASLTPIEGLMLELFMNHPGQVITKENLFKYIWKHDQFDPNSLNVYINFLRKKIEKDPSNPNLIQTIHGVGYRFVEESV